MCFPSFRIRCSLLGAQPTHWKLFCSKVRLKKCLQTKLRQIGQGHPNRAFPHILQQEDQGKLSQKVDRIYGHKKKHPGAKWTCLLIKMHLKCQHQRTICRKQRLQKCPQSRAMANSARKPKSNIFWDFATGRTRETEPKRWPTSGAWKTPRRKWPYLLISMR